MATGGAAPDRLHPSGSGPGDGHRRDAARRPVRRRGHAAALRPGVARHRSRKHPVAGAVRPHGQRRLSRRRSVRPRPLPTRRLQHRDFDGRRDGRHRGLFGDDYEQRRDERRAAVRRVRAAAPRSSSSSTPREFHLLDLDRQRSDPRRFAAGRDRRFGDAAPVHQPAAARGAGGPQRPQRHAAGGQRPAPRELLAGRRRRQPDRPGPPGNPARHGRRRPAKPAARHRQRRVPTSSPTRFAA